MPTVPTCLLGFVRWTALPSFCLFWNSSQHCFTALKLTWFRASAIALDDFHFLLSWDLCFQDPINILIISLQQPPPPLTHQHPDEIPQCCWGQTQSCSLGLPGCHRGCALHSLSEFWESMCQCWGAWGLGRSSWAAAYNANLPGALLCFPSCDSLCLQHRLSSSGFPQNPRSELTLHFPVWSLPYQTRSNRHRWRRTFRSLGAGVEGHYSTRDVGFQKRLTPSWPAYHF